MIVDAFGNQMTDTNFNNLNMVGEEHDWVAEIEFNGTGLYFMPDDEDEVSQYGDFFDWQWDCEKDNIATVEVIEHPDYDSECGGLFRCKITSDRMLNLSIALDRLDNNLNVDSNIRIVTFTNQRRSD